jgi:hypothetical protein
MIPKASPTSIHKRETKGGTLKAILTTIALAAVLVAGCNVSPFSPTNRPRIKNSGEIGDTNTNQNGVMAEIMSLKNRMDVIARDVENLQSGLINSSNRNFGVQIFQGEGGLAAGVVVVVALASLAVSYKLRGDRYKKAAEIFGEQVRNIGSEAVEEKVFAAALASKVERDVYKILKG